MSQAENFKDLGLDTRLIKILDHQGIYKPTEIQEQAVPTAMVGHDLIASSKTGSGKTLAFLLPAMQRLMKQKALTKRDPRVLVLAPTRELAKQVYAQLRSLTSGTQFKAALVLGGENFNDQAKALAKDPHVVVATPGRLANHLDERSLFLAGLELLILDEADRMLDLGFAEQLQQINNIANHRLRQTLMFSATLDHAEVNAIASQLLKAPKRIAIGAANAEHGDIEKRFYLADHLDHKQALLEKILDTETYQQAIIFTATRSDTDRLSLLLSDKGLKTVALSGEMSQADRNKIMDSFSRGQQQVLITTDVASRGLDLLQVSLVVNFDMPKQAEEYVHRIGRTGRAGAKGVALSLVGPKDWDSFKRVESFLQQPLNFSEMAGLKAKFKGLKPAPKPKSADKGVQVKAKPKRVVKAPQDRKNRRQANRQIVSDDGLAPLKKKK
ncbi:DEAD/DEAH box helicase [Amphritea balenae]|uniref:DEAD/DEAH box helicase n=1 Tax=Amphritea balenae TaxID=452629 RepID=A0A3P1SUW2_9GAMM|nr:DEAD/DEAH box helicase [Amphritea balenae]RRC99942.1 DEAD/DEAH box helicase [Amphritea balenae]GGK75299.1 RNA helicase [Amphritea balenae]